MKFGRHDATIALGAVLLFAASFAVCWPALRGDFLWDDVSNIYLNPVVQSPRGLLDIWLGGRDVHDYYPLTWTTWWLEWRAWGRATLGYHVLNVLLHAGAAAFMWRVLVRLAVPGAFVAALVFAVHPVNIETVAWISERKNTLSMFLLAITMALYLDSESDRRPPRQRRGLYWASVVTFALALLAKPSVVALPVVLLVLAWWQRGRVARQDWLRSVPFFALSAAIAVVTVLVHHARGIGTSEVRTDGFLSRLVGAGWAVWFYLYKLVWPANLSFIYPRWELNPKSALHWLPAAGLLAAFAALFLARRRLGRGPLAALACYVAMLFPVLGFVDIYFMRFSLVSDHWQYPACLAVIAALTAAVASALRGLPVRFGRPLAGALAIAACGALGLLAWREAHFYRTNRALWAEAVRDNPRSAMAQINLTTAMSSVYSLDELRERYLYAIGLDPAVREGYVAMGNTYMREGRAAEAAQWYRRAVGRQGSGHDPRIRLAEALSATGSPDEAVDYYEQALAADADAPVDRAGLAVLHESAGRKARAIELYREIVRLRPADPDAWFLLAQAHRRMGNNAEAQTAMDEARRLAAADHAMLTAMGSRLLVSGWPDLAVQPLADAVRVRPDYGPAHNHLGRAMEQMGHLKEAAAHYSRALAVQPGFREAQVNFDRVTAAAAGGGAPATGESRPSAKPQRTPESR